MTARCGKLTRMKDQSCVKRKPFEIKLCNQCFKAPIRCQSDFNYLGASPLLEIAPEMLCKSPYLVEFVCHRILNFGANQSLAGLDNL